MGRGVGEDAGARMLDSYCMWGWRSEVCQSAGDQFWCISVLELTVSAPYSQTASIKVYCQRGRHLNTGGTSVLVGDPNKRMIL